MGACKGLGGCREGGAWRVPGGMERPRAWIWGRPFPLLSPRIVVCSSLLTLQVRPQKHKVKTQCQLQVDRTSAPTASTSLWAVPCPRLGHLSGLSLRGGAIRTQEGEAAGIIPTPQAGTGSGQLKQNSRPDLPPLWALCHTRVHLRTPGEQDGGAGLRYLGVHRARCRGGGT